jgi:protein SCO1
MGRTLWIFLGSVAAITAVLYFALNIFDDYVSDLPVYGPATEVNGEYIEHTIPNFEMLNQSGRKVSLGEIEGHVAVVNFFFTSCPTICPKMMRNMQRVQELYLDDDNVSLLSFTVDPKRDTPSKLKAYAEKYHIVESKWSLLTGDKKEIYSLARNGFYLTASQGDGGDYDFIHSENLVLIDRQKRLRGYYEGTDTDAVDQLINDIAKLKRDKT